MKVLKTEQEKDLDEKQPSWYRWLALRLFW